MRLEETFGKSSLQTSLKTFNALMGRVRTSCHWRLVGRDMAEKAYRGV